MKVSLLCCTQAKSFSLPLACFWRYAFEGIHCRFWHFLILQRKNVSWNEKKYADIKRAVCKYSTWKIKKNIINTPSTFFQAIFFFSPSPSFLLQWYVKETSYFPLYFPFGFLHSQHSFEVNKTAYVTTLSLVNPPLIPFPRFENYHRTSKSAKKPHQTLSTVGFT